jgi:hypothetical protein
LDITSKNGSVVKGKYAQTKKLGVKIAEIKLKEYSENAKFIEIYNKSKKKDDLSDCYLQALTYCLFNKLLKKITSEIEPETFEKAI